MSVEQNAEGNALINMNDRDRGYISTSPVPDPYSYFKPNLLGGYVTYDINISNLPCGCITALYQVLMPAKQEDGTLWERHYWYCGAQQSKYGGELCPEFDIMEANQWGLHTTAHPCEPPNEFGHYSACDFQGQCVVDIEDIGAIDRYGPGSEFDINTLETFNVRLDYHDFEGHFVGYTTTLTQGDQQIVLTGDCRDYLNRMTPDISGGMAFVVSSWNPPSATWLQGDRCNEECVWPVHTAFENLEFWTYGGQAAKDVEFVYGGTCGNLRYGKCDDVDHCSECAFSYPADEPDEWQSPWASCRCKDTNKYSYGNPCEDDEDQSKCGSNCQHCNKSWQPSDPDRWLSPDAQCRCVPFIAEYNITYGNYECNALDNGTCGQNCSSCRWSWPSEDPLQNKSVDAMCRCAEENPLLQ